MIAKLIDAVTGLKWKIFTGLGAAAALTLGFMLLVEKTDNRHLTKTVTNLNQQHEHDLKDLSQARTNVAQLRGAIDTLNQELSAQAAAAAATLAKTEQALDASKADAAKARRQSAKILAAPADLNAVDAAVLESLK